MEQILKELASGVALACELAAVAVVGLAAMAALVRSAIGWRAYGDLTFKKRIWVQFATNITLALEFALAADIARTAIAPTWREIGQLAAIAAIRTGLNLFLERDIEAFSRGDESDVRVTATRAAP